MKFPQEDEQLFEEESPLPQRDLPGPLRPLLPVGRTIRDWWRDLLPLSLACFAWAALSLTVIGGPPAGAALFAMCRASILHEEPDTRLFVGALRAYFLKSWLLGLVSAAGIAIWVVDLMLYAGVATQAGLVGQLGLFAIIYVGVTWLQTLFYAWALLVCRPDLKLLQLLRNGMVLALRNPLQTYLNTLYIALVFVLGYALPALFVLLAPLHVALLGLHSLYVLAPELVPEDAEAFAIVG
jgi:uncharacterized membrane protein YesL